MSSANRDEAERCIRIAKQAMAAGHRQQAERFLMKSMRLFRTEEAERLQDELAQEDTSRQQYGDDENASSNNNSFSHGSNVHHRANAGQQRSGSRSRARDPDHAESSPGTEEVHYTEEQSTEVNRIMRSKKNYYDVLQMEKESYSLTVLKKQYKKLALSVHPDKNKAPHSGEAFKVVGAAYAVLSEPSKKSQYDHLLATGGSTESGMFNRTAGGAYEYEEDISPEEIFNMFFGGGQYQRRGAGARTFVFHRGRPNRFHDDAGGPDGFRPVLLQLAPIILLILISVASHFLTPDPDWSFVPSSRYSVPMTTTGIGVKFYVKSSVPQEYNEGGLRDLESQVESHYVHNLREQCIREKHQRETMIWRAKLYADRNWLDKAKAMPTPSCEQLAKVYT